MKNGYYIFAYIEINKFANYYKTDTKRHDQNLSLWKYNNGNLSLVRYWELERLSRIKHHNKAFSSEDQFKNLLKSLLDEFKLKLTDINEIFAYPYLNKKIEYIDKNYNYHSMCHLFSSLLLDTSIFYYEDILAFSVDLESDYISEKKDSKKNDYVGCFSQKGKLSFFPIESPAPLWSAVSHDLKLGEGTLMALSSALKTEFINNLDFSDERFFKYNYEKTIKTYQKIKELASACNKDNVKTTLKNYNNKFSFDDNLKSAIMKVIQKISLSTMERNVEYAIQTFKINLKETILAISGGFALNCPTNSSLLNSYKFKNFIAPPCVNDSGQSLGMALYHFYLNARKQLKFSLDTAFYGKHYSTKNAINLYRNYIVSVNCFNPQIAAKDVINDVIVWLDGCSEIGPRALGHRSIISIATSIEAKNKINTIKKRQFWRPVAPIVLEEYGASYFENFISSKFMLLTFKIKPHVKKNISAVSHLDNSSRIQTIKIGNEKITQIIEQIYKQSGVPICCNTSLNDYNEPIIDTPEEAIFFALKKKIEIVYINGKRIKLDLTKDIVCLEKPKCQVDLWLGVEKIDKPPLTKEEYDFYYWSNLETDFPLEDENSIKIVKRLYSSYKNSTSHTVNYQNFYY